jgi:hydroxyacylglutathione hydrolase
VILARRRFRADNYLYLLAEGAEAALVDPADPEAALALCSELGLRPRWILHTHGHADHAGGSAELRGRLGARVLGHAADAAWFEPDEDLAGRTELRLGGLRLTVHHAPGHTPGSLLLQADGWLLTGDTLFWGGAGNCRNGGDPARLATSLVEVLGALDGALLVHPGHDYALANLPFALELEPGNAAAAARLAAVQAARAEGREPEPTSLAEERALNPFLRTATPALADALAARGLTAADPVGRAVLVRRLRDGWVGKGGSPAGLERR